MYKINDGFNDRSYFKQWKYLRQLFNKRIFTGKASAIDDCQKRVTNTNKALKDNISLSIPPSISVFNGKV